MDGVSVCGGNTRPPRCTTPPSGAAPHVASSEVLRPQHPTFLCEPSVVRPAIDHLSKWSGVVSKLHHPQHSENDIRVVVRTHLSDTLQHSAISCYLRASVAGGWAFAYPSHAPVARTKRQYLTGKTSNGYQNAPPSRTRHSVPFRHSDCSLLEFGYLREESGRESAIQKTYII